MRFQLRDEKLRTALDRLSNGCFSEMLNEQLTREGLPAEGSLVTIYFKIQIYEDREIRLAEATFRVEDFIEHVEYDPHKWNEWPKTKPPRDKLMAVEVFNPAYNLGPEHCPEAVFYRGAATWNGFRWMNRDEDLLQMLSRELSQVRFRPWNEE